MWRESDQCFLAAKAFNIFHSNITHNHTNHTDNTNTGPAAGLMPFYSPVQCSLCNSRSPGIYVMLLRLCWNMQLHVWMCNLGGSGLVVQPDWAAGTA